MTNDQVEYFKARQYCWLLMRHKTKIRPAWMGGATEEELSITQTADSKINVEMILLSKNLRPFSISTTLEEIKANTITSSPYSGFTEYEGKPAYIDLKPNRQYMKAINLRDLILQYPPDPEVHNYFRYWTQGPLPNSVKSMMQILGDEKTLGLRQILYGYITRAPEQSVFDVGDAFSINKVRTGELSSLILNRHIALDGDRIVYKGDVVGSLTKGLWPEFQIYSNYINKTTGLNV